ncbi:MAG: hypothetical protein AAFU41_11905 [Pseudomonadota bacterium]
MKSLLTLLFTLTFVLSPLATEPFTGFRADQLPIPQIRPPVQPAGYAFAIWGLIYAWLVVSAVFGVIARRTDAIWDRARGPLIISLAVGTPWLAIANESAVWATFTIFIMAAAAIAALLRAPAHDRWWLRAPVSIYAGWLTAASFVALGSTAAGYGLIMDQVVWAYAGILGALAVAVPVTLKTASPGYPLTVIWALVGIVVANSTALLPVSAVAAAGIVILSALMLRRTATARGSS